MCISDSEADNEHSSPSLGRPKSDAAGRLCRSTAVKSVNYSTKHHPQDPYIPSVRRPRKRDAGAGDHTSSAKRLKMTNNGASVEHAQL